MKIRPSCLCLSLLASLWAGGVAPATGEDAFPSGKVGLALSPSSISGIPIDVAALTEHVCGQPSPKRPLVQCHVIVKNINLEVEVENRHASVSQLQFSGAEPVATPCGLWDTTLTLDPTFPRPASPLALEERPADPGRGLFAVFLEMNTNLHLANRETGQTADFPLSLGLALAGPWVLAPPVESPTASRLILLADWRDGEMLTFKNCVPAWVFKNPHFLVIPKVGCEICLNGVAPNGSTGAGS